MSAIAKVHLRRQTDGRVLIQGVVPVDQVFFLEAMLDGGLKSDMVAAVDIIVGKAEDRTTEYTGLSNSSILRSGMP